MIKPALLFVAFFSALQLTSLAGWVDFRFLLSPFMPEILSNYVVDSETVFRRKPNSKTSGSFMGGDLAWALKGKPYKEYSWDMQFDDNGFPNEKSYKEIDVALLGDSFTEGVLVDREDSIAHLLTQEGAKVANFSISGYGPRHQLEVLKKFVAEKNPKLVFWFFFEGNDIFDLQNYRDTIDSPEEHLENIKYAFSPSTFFSVIGLFLKPLWSESAPSSKAKKQRCFVGDQEFYFGYKSEKLDAIKKKELEEIYIKASQLVENIVIVYIPTKLSVYRELCRYDKDSELPSWPGHSLDSELKALLPNTMKFVDLTPALKATAKKGTMPYYSDDTHWSPKGHGVAARELLTFLKELQ